MEQIVLEVDKSVSKIYQEMSAKEKQTFGKAIGLMLKKAVNDATFADYSKLLDEIGTGAVKNGLTPEVLDALLASND